MEQIAHKIGSLILDLIFPCFCLSCNKEGAFLCEKCRSTKLKFLNKHSRPLCAFDYENTLVRELVYAFKYEQLKSLDKTLASLMFDFLKEKKIRFDQTWTVSFVPSHPRKENIRGFNQSELLAKRLAGILGLACSAALKKIRSTRPQMQLNRIQRLDNLKAAFEAIGSVKNKKIILIDDVCTTGATMNECRDTLLAAGASRVSCFAFAKDI